MLVCTMPVYQVSVYHVVSIYDLCITACQVGTYHHDVYQDTVYQCVPLLPSPCIRDLYIQVVVCIMPKYSRENMFEIRFVVYPPVPVEADWYQLSVYQAWYVILRV